MMRRLLKPGIFLLCLVPMALIVFDGFTDSLGANPIEEITHRTGDWALRLLLITLAVTPARRLLNWTWATRLRRMLGLFAFFYVLLHFLTYLVLDQYFDWGEILKDIAKRPYITIGFAAFVMLIPLTVTSTNGMIRRMGQRWHKLHKLVYVIGVFSVFHYLWLVKADLLQPVIYAIILIALLSVRSWFRHQSQARRRQVASAAPA